jgi:hypothetical protein
MATQDAYPEHLGVPADARTPTTAERHRTILDRWRERKHERLMSARNRRVLAQWLRLTAKHATDRDPIRRRHDVLLHYRAAAVRTDLLEIAALLERGHDPDPECITLLHDLLANHIADSPLYNPNIPFTELQTTLDKVRSGLRPGPTSKEHLSPRRPVLVRRPARTRSRGDGRRRTCP